MGVGPRLTSFPRERSVVRRRRTETSPECRGPRRALEVPESPRTFVLSRRKHDRDDVLRLTRRGHWCVDAPAPVKRNISGCAQDRSVVTGDTGPGAVLAGPGRTGAVEAGPPVTDCEPIDHGPGSASRPPSPGRPDQVCRKAPGAVCDHRGHRSRQTTPQPYDADADMTTGPLRVDRYADVMRLDRPLR